MSYYGDKETYVPKFKIGDTVYHDRDHDKIRTVTGRKVRRNMRQCDTYYELDNGSDLRSPGAWEMNLQPTSELLEPGVVLARILPMFDAPIYLLNVTPRDFCLVLKISETRKVKLFADVDKGKVPTLGEWTWSVHNRNATTPNWSVQRGTAPNLGRALVDASNALHGHTS